jgi:hypothetical protein
MGMRHYIDLSDDALMGIQERSGAAVHAAPESATNCPQVASSQHQVLSTASALVGLPVDHFCVIDSFRRQAG